MAASKKTVEEVVEELVEAAPEEAPAEAAAEAGEAAPEQPVEASAVERPADFDERPYRYHVVTNMAGEVVRFERV